MISPTPTAISNRRMAPRGHPEVKGGGSEAGTTLSRVPGDSYWVEPDTGHTYPISYRAYRRMREAEEKPPPRHRRLGPEIDHYVWRRWRGLATPPVEVRLTFQPGAPPRVRRIVAEILRAIRRGQPATAAIRHVSRRFGLRYTRARAFLTACVGFETRPRQNANSTLASTYWALDSSGTGWR